MKGINFFGYITGIIWVLLVTMAIVVKDIPAEQIPYLALMLYLSGIVIMAVFIVKILEIGGLLNEPTT